MADVLTTLADGTTKLDSYSEFIEFKPRQFGAVTITQPNLERSSYTLYQIAFTTQPSATPKGEALAAIADK